MYRHFHPFPAYTYHRGGFRGRILWFAFGAFAATWWMKHRDDRDANGNRRFDWGRRDRLNERQYPASPAQNQSEPIHRERDEGYDVVQRGEFNDRERLRELSNQALEGISDVSESVLNTAISTLDNFRAVSGNPVVDRMTDGEVLQKLDEQRALRDRMENERKREQDRRFV